MADAISKQCYQKVNCEERRVAYGDRAFPDPSARDSADILRDWRIALADARSVNPDTPQQEKELADKLDVLDIFMREMLGHPMEERHDLINLMELLLHYMDDGIEYADRRVQRMIFVLNCGLRRL